MKQLRLEEHPVLGAPEERKKITFYYDGRAMQGYEGEPISAALRAAGVMAHRHTRKEGSPRGVFCAIGRCTDCVMIVDGRPNVRTCITALEKGMHIQTQYGTGSREGGGQNGETV